MLVVLAMETDGYHCISTNSVVNTPTSHSSLRQCPANANAARIVRVPKVQKAAGATSGLKPIRIETATDVPNDLRRLLLYLAPKGMRGFKAT